MPDLEIKVVAMCKMFSKTCDKGIFPLSNDALKNALMAVLSPPHRLRRDPSNWFVPNISTTMSDHSSH